MPVATILPSPPREFHLLELNGVLVERDAHDAVGQADAQVVQRDSDATAVDIAGEQRVADRAGKLQGGRQLAIERVLRPGEMLPAS
ncbi:hypothetical protein ACU4GD_15385 [Cupriavidus basilensis]